MTTTEADSIDKLYKNYEILNDAKEKISEVSECEMCLGVLDGARVNVLNYVANGSHTCTAICLGPSRMFSCFVSIRFACFC